MKELLTKPIKLFNTVQHYDWGTINEEAFIPELLGIPAEKDKPYAELWIGAHPKAPSKISYKDELVDINLLIDKFPYEVLGSDVATRFDNKLPFLLKILSSRKSLSIQTHPNKEQAKVLHKESPENYPDENHKPEIAIALDKLYALVGIKPLNEIKNVFETFPFLKDYFSEDILLAMFNANPVQPEGLVKGFMSELLSLEKEKISFLLKIIEEQINSRSEVTLHEKFFLENRNLFHDDVGLLAFLFFNFVTVGTGEGFYTDAGIPHAYLRGNIVECMANSDNVVRAGLTPKYKDVKTLLNIFKYSNDKPEFLKPESNIHRYVTDAMEFELRRFNLYKNEEVNYIINNRVCIFVISAGEVICELDSNRDEQHYRKGDVFLVAALNKSVFLKSLGSATLFMATVPEMSH